MRHGISRLALLSALAGTGLAGGALAQETDEPQNLGTITLTAGATPTDLSRTGASVDVVTAEDLAKAPLSLGQALARLPGVSFTATGGPGTASALRLRGLPNYYTGFRIDGIDVTDPSGTQIGFNIGSMTTAGLSRVEVLRGSQSALYGSEAIGGVVDITSFRPTRDGFSGEAAVEAGSDKTRSGSIGLGFSGARGEFSLTASRTTTDGISALAGGTEKDGFRSTFIGFNGAYDLTEAVRVGISGFHRKTHADYDDSFTPDANAPWFQDVEQRALRGFVEVRTGSVTHELSVSRMKSERIEDSGWLYPYDGTRRQLSYKGNWEGNGFAALAWGLDRTDEDYVSSSDRGEERTNSVFAELSLTPREDLDISLALRHDSHQNFGGRTTGRLALAWRPTEDWVIRAVAATGFRAPSLYERNAGWGTGNPNLQPEESRSFELGAERLFAEGSFRATLFHTEIDDKITYERAPWFSYRQLPGTTRSRGLELSGDWAVSSAWTVFGNYTYTDSVTTGSTGRSREALVPRHDLTLGVEGSFAGGWGASFSLRHVADVVDSAGKMGDYTLANLGVTYDLSETAQASLRVENLFDEDYQTVRGYGQPGRQVFLGVRTSF